MMRFFKLKTWIPAFAAVVSLMAVPAQAEAKIGVLDYGRLMEESPQGKVLLETLRNDAATKQRELQLQGQSLQGKRDKLGKDRATMSPDQISRAEKEVRDGERDLARRQQEIQDDFNAKRNEETSKLQRGLIEDVRAYAKLQNFDIVIAEGVIYSSPVLDMTSGLLKILQDRLAPRPAAAPAAAVPKR